MKRLPPSATLCLCALSFVVGRFIQQIPGLPQVPQGAQVTIRKDDQPGRRLLPEEAVNPKQPSVNSNRPAYSSFEEAVANSQQLQARPPVEVSDSGLGSDAYLTQPFQHLSWYPRTYLFPGFLTKEQSEQVVAAAKARLAPSALAVRRTDDSSKQENIRTSSGTFLSGADDKHGVLRFIEEKIALLTGLPASHGEPFNVLRYQLSQHYDAHYDVFDPESYGPQSSQRMATVLFYLTDVEEGGETVFPLEGKDGLQRLNGLNYKSCDQGLRYKPRQGDALLFWSMHPNGTFDKHALHGGCPVVSGEKWVATKWIRDRCFSGNCL